MSHWNMDHRMVALACLRHYTREQIEDMIRELQLGIGVDDTQQLQNDYLAMNQNGVVKYSSLRLAVIDLIAAIREAWPGFLEFTPEIGEAIERVEQAFAERGPATAKGGLK